MWVALVAMSLAFTVLLRAKPRDAIWIVIAGAIAFTGRKNGSPLGKKIGVGLYLKKQLCSSSKHKSNLCHFHHDKG
jgi:hypothetical protein